MMKQRSPLRLIALGFALLIMGFLLPFLMVMRILEPGFFMSFLAHAASVGGLIVGLLGAAQYSGRD